MLNTNSSFIYFYYLYTYFESGVYMTNFASYTYNL